jgi:hypothetical protein
MSDLHRLIWSTLVGVFRSRIATLAEIMVLRHQLNMLRRRSPKRAVLNNIDRLVFVGLYRVAPQVLEMLQIIKPEGDPLALRWFSSLLALEIMTARWPAGDAT